MSASCSVPVFGLASVLDSIATPVYLLASGSRGLVSLGSFDERVS